MATETPGIMRTFSAGADLSAKQFTCMKITAANTVTFCAATTDFPVGILQNKPDASGKAAAVMLGGISKATLGGTVTAGATVGTHSDGTLVAKTADTDMLIGIALTAGSSGEIIDVLVTPNTERAST